MSKVLYIIFLFLSFNTFGQITYYGGESGEKFDHFIYYLENYYVEETNEDSLTDLAIRHVLTALDRFSTYQTIEESQAQLNADKGFNPKGCGLDFYILNNDKYIINYISPGGPAEKLGIQVHDQLKRINGIGVMTVSKDSIYNILNGPLDTLRIDYQKHSGEVKSVELVKTLIPFSSIVSSYMVDSGIGYIKMIRFTTNTVDEFENSISKLKLKGLESLILDLRGNPGGVKASVLPFADHFLSGDKLISYSQGGHFPREETKTEIDGLFEKGRLIVLTDNITASASELFSVAIQDWDRGVIMGEETFGKGLIQQSYKLKDGSTVRLTIAKYYSPTGRLIQKQEYKNWTKAVSNQIPPNGKTAKGIFEPIYFGETKSGRKILIGEGGVIPDIYIPKDEQTELNNWSYYKSGYVYDFAVQYSFVQRNILLQRYNDAKALKSDPALDDQILLEIKNYLTRKKFSEAGSSDFIFPKSVCVKIKSWIASFLWGNKAYHEVNNMNDSLILRAIGLLSNEDLYFDLLKR